MKNASYPIELKKLKAINACYINKPAENKTTINQYNGANRLLLIPAGNIYNKNVPIGKI